MSQRGQKRKGFFPKRFTILLDLKVFVMRLAESPKRGEAVSLMRGDKVAIAGASALHGGWDGLAKDVNDTIDFLVTDHQRRG